MKLFYECYIKIVVIIVVIVYGINFFYGLMFFLY